MLNSSSIKIAAVLGGMILAASSVSNAQVSGLRDEGIFYSAIASTGTPDEDSVALMNASRSLVMPKQSGTLTLRYNVEPSAELAAAEGIVHLIGSLRDPGIGAKVILSLVEVDVGAGEAASASATQQRAVLSMQSTDLEAATGVSNQCASDGSGFRFDFENKAYYLEAKLIWDAAVNPAAPQLRAVRIGVFREDHCQ